VAILFRRKIVRFALGAVILCAALPIAHPNSRSSGASAETSFTGYLNPTPPQRADGDFDGDGRVDVAVIQERGGGTRLAIQLSSAASVVELEPSVTGVVQSDIDHDGDLDLVAATASGDLLVWLNDGHGRFTQQTASHTRSMSTDSVASESTPDELVAVGNATVLLDSASLAVVRFVSTAIPSPLHSNVRFVQSVIPPPLRAPPIAST
jgi:hypothetical protein